MARATHIENYLVTVRKGQWFGWSDSKNKVYANLIVHDDGAKPSESACTNGLKAMQDAWDLENKEYKSNRQAEYPTIAEQLDLLYKDMVADKGDKSGAWFAAVKAVKDKYPKE